MLSSIQVECPGCSARIKAPAQLIGQNRNCPRCGQRFKVQLETPQDSGPILQNDTPLKFPVKMGSR